MSGFWILFFFLPRRLHYMRSIANNLHKLQYFRSFGFQAKCFKLDCTNYVLKYTMKNNVQHSQFLNEFLDLL